MEGFTVLTKTVMNNIFQWNGGDGEGASQSSVCRIVKQVSKALASHANDLISFSLDDDILETVSTGFYGFKGSK